MVLDLIVKRFGSKRALKRFYLNTLSFAYSIIHHASFFFAFLLVMEAFTAFAIKHSSVFSAFFSK